MRWQALFSCRPSRLTSPVPTSPRTRSMRRRYQRYLNRFSPALRLRHIPMIVGIKLESRPTAVKIAYSNGLGYIGDEDLAIADFARLGSARQGLHYFFAATGGEHPFHALLWDEGQIRCRGTTRPASA